MSRLSAIVVVLLLLPWASTVTAEADSRHDDTRPGPVLVIGDSLSADYGFERGRGWVSLLAERMREHGHDRAVVNAAISGDTTRSGRARLPRALEEQQPSVVIIQLGGNDGLRGLDLGEAQANLAAMIEVSQAAGAQVLLAGVRLPPNYGRPYIEAFAAMYAELAETHQVALVPRILAGVGEREDLMQPDGIHPTADAQPVILDNLWPALIPLLTHSARE